jgi:TPR repeat protein
VRCSHCGNENPETHRFCGMCGASLLQGPGAAMAAPGNSITTPQTTQPGIAPRANAVEPAPAAPAATIAPPAAPQPQPAAHAPQRAVEQEPVISGPSFLGLNEPAPTPKRGSLSIDPDSAPRSGNLDYLLEDDEPNGGGGWKVVLILIALALAVSFGYLRWKNQGLPFLNPSPNPAAQAPANTQSAQSPDTSTTAPAGANSANTPAGTAAPPSTPSTAAANSISTATPAAAAAQPQANAPASAAAGAAAPPPTNSAPGVAPNGASSAITPVTSSGSAANPSAPANGGTGPSGNASANSGPEAQPVTPKKSDDGNSPAADKKTAEDSPTPEITRKPAAAIKQVDTVAEAQRYLYGKGVPQSCDHGLRLLKPAANAGNPKAMIEMGALYSAGLCTPRDLPTSYRWFAMALRKDPANQSVATDLQKLWGEMTQPERQLAIRLSQ